MPEDQKSPEPVVVEATSTQAPTHAQESSEQFSETEKGKELVKKALESLKIEVGSDRANKITEAIDAEFKAKREEISRESADARRALVDEIAEQPQEQATGVEPQTDEQIIETLKKIIEKEIVEEEMKVSDLKTLTKEELMGIEAKSPGSLIFAFTTWGDKYAHVKIADFEPYKNPAPGTEVEIHFRDNEEAYWKVGAGDILPKNVQCVTITDDGGNQRTGALRESPRNGFYDSNGYIPIFDNYKIKIEPPEKAQEIQPKTQPSGEEVQADEEETVVLGRTTRTVRSSPSEPRSRARRTPRSSRERRECDTRPIPEWLDNDWRTAGEEASRYYAQRLGVRVNPAVIFAIIKHESGFKPGIANQSGSKALGLGQFMPGTWKSFLEANPGLIRELSPGNPNPKRTDPILSIYATTWYTASNAKRFGIKEVTQNNAAEIYLMHHNGEGGYRDYKKYRELMTQGKSEKEAAREAQFRVPGEPGTYYRRRFGTNTERYARFLEDFSVPIQQTAIRYSRELGESGLA